MTFAEIIRSAREKAGLSQSQLAKKAGVSVRTVQEWEQGRRSPVTADCVKVAITLGVDMKDLRAMNDTPKQPRKRHPKKKPHSED